jgi:hypothetical protein
MGNSRNFNFLTRFVFTGADYRTCAQWVCCEIELYSFKRQVIPQTSYTDACRFESGASGNESLGIKQTIAPYLLIGIFGTTKSCSVASHGAISSVETAVTCRKS